MNPEELYLFRYTGIRLRGAKSPPGVEIVEAQDINQVRHVPVTPRLRGDERRKRQRQNEDEEDESTFDRPERPDRGRLVDFLA